MKGQLLDVVTALGWKKADGSIWPCFQSLGLYSQDNQLHFDESLQY